MTNMGAAVARGPVARLQAIVQQLAALERELFELDFPVAGARVAVVVEQLGHDLTNKLRGEGRLCHDEEGDGPSISDAVHRHDRQWPA